MRKLIFLLLLILSYQHTYAQNDDRIKCNSFIAGMSSLCNDDIKGTECIFPENVYDYYFDTISLQMLVLLREQREGKWQKFAGKAILMDLQKGTVNWTKDIDYRFTYITQRRNVIIETYKKKSYRLDPKTGERLWEIDGNISYVSLTKNVGIGYKEAFWASARINFFGVDLNTGKTIWTKQVVVDNGWDEGYYMMHDSLLVLKQPKFSVVYIADGKNWEYQQDFLISSNLYSSGTSIYLASLGGIARFEYGGELIWDTNLPDDSTSYCTIGEEEGVIYAANRGYDYPSSYVKYGTPFIAGFNKENGKKIYLNPVGTNREQIRNFDVYNRDTVKLLLNNRVVRHTLKDGKFISSSSFEPKKKEEWLLFVGKRIYVETGKDVYRSLVITNPDKHYILTSENNIYELNDQSEITNMYGIPDIYVHYMDLGDVQFIAKGNQTIVINSIGEKIGNFRASRNAILVEDKLYDIQGGSLIVVDLKEFLGQCISNIGVRQGFYNFRP